MQFCPTCDNKLYMRIQKPSDDEKIDSQSEHNPKITSEPLVLHCKNCTFFTELKNDDELPFTFDPCMYRSNYSKDHPLYYSTVVNKYTVNDPTLPRTSDMPCPNKDCVSKNADGSVIPEVIYIRYNDEDMKYLYLCKHCKWCWRTPSYQMNQILFKLQD